MALLVLGFLFLGKGFGVKTVYISVLMSVALSAAEKLFPMSGPLTDQPVLELIFAIAIPASAPQSCLTWVLPAAARTLSP